MKAEKHFHPIMALHFLRRTLAVYLLPLVNVLLERDGPALRAALRQDAALFAALSCVSGALLYGSDWAVDAAGAVHVRWKLGVRWKRTLCPGRLDAVVIERSLVYRLAGASRVTLYPSGEPKQRAVTLYLRRVDAEFLAERLFPMQGATVHAPRGAERLALVLLGANGLSTLVLLVVAVRQTRTALRDLPALPSYLHPDALEAAATHWLPAGTAWVLTLACLVLGVSLARSFGQSVHYEVWRTAHCLGTRGGWLRRFEVRMAADRLTCAEVRLSPAARLLHCRPVFVTAGACAPDFPLFVCRAGQEGLFRELLPAFRLPPEAPVDTAGRSVVAFFLPAGGPCALCLVLVCVSRFTLPGATPVLLVLTLWCAAHLGGAWVGWRREGVWVTDGYLTFVRQKGLRLHCGCALYTPCLTAKQTPWAVAAHRANLTLHFPGGITETVRSIPELDAERCFEYHRGACEGKEK